MSHKSKYKVKNWRSYNKALCQRGSITLWICPALLMRWKQIDPKHKEVGVLLYCDGIIEACLTIGKVYKLPLRQTTGLISSILNMAHLGDLSVPDYSTLSRRSSGISIALSNTVGSHIHIAVDSTGLKVYGEGEWKVRKHGYSKHRTWRKLHIGIDVASQQVVAVDLTENCVDDAEVVNRGLLSAYKGRLGNFHADGAYDKFKCRKQIKELGGASVIPPPGNAVKSESEQAALLERNRAIERIEEVGRRQWKQEVGYHRRSLVEVAMYRYKTILGDKLAARRMDNQSAEAKIGCHILNVFNSCGMPLSYKVA